MEENNGKLETRPGYTKRETRASIDNDVSRYINQESFSLGVITLKLKDTQLLHLLPHGKKKEHAASVNTVKRIIR